MHPIILSGGSGSRLWPLSREAFPKPFLPLPAGGSLIQETLKRVATLPNVSHVTTITNRDYYFLSRDHYAELPVAKNKALDFLLEPMARNTAAAIAVAAMQIKESEGGDALMLVVPADHLIEDQKSFGEAVAKAEALAREGNLVVFGVKPTHPETGYGYVEADEQNPILEGVKVKRFVEKPSLAEAEQYIASGRFYWNSGMFCFQADTLLEELRHCAPDVYVACEKCWQVTAKEIQPVTIDASFSDVPELSIDYAVMERSSRVVMVPAQFDWSDIGSWDAFADLVPADAQGNRTQGNVMLENSRNCFVSSKNHLTAVLGMENLVVVETPDALLVTSHDQVQNVRSVVKRLKDSNSDAYKFNRTVHRPWGTFTVLEEGPRYKIKLITVKPGASLSLQMHMHRSEHWVVVSGTAQVVIDDSEFIVRSNESRYIHTGSKHRLVNPGVIECAIIEVQCGDYVGEDDIVRFEDKYNRV